MSGNDVLVIGALWALVLGAVLVAGVMTGNFYVAGLVGGLIGGLVTGEYVDESRERTQVLEDFAAQPTRKCPRCANRMRRQATTCPFCFTSLSPWILHGGVWWVGSGLAGCQWLDEQAGVWRWYDDSTPSTPSVITATPGLAPDPAPVDSRPVVRSGRAEASTTQSSGGSA